MEAIGRRSLRGGTGAAAWMVVVAIMVVMLTCAEGNYRHGPYLHKVGGLRGGWDKDINYTEWAASEERKKRFYVGDWLYFRFDKHYFNVLEVNKTSYDNCIDRDFITNITKGGRDVFNLTNAQPYYFLSSGGYCYHGMRLAINVQEFVPIPDASFPQSMKGATSDTSCGMVLSSLLLTISLGLAILFTNSSN